MSNKTIKEKFQSAYKSMLEHIEELIDKDEKPLEEAFREAEEKLSELRELSREEIAHLSKELKSNLTEVGEVSHKLNESLKDTLSFDADYLAGSVWNTLSKVSDRTSLELEELSQSLRKHTVTDASNYSEQLQVWLEDAKVWHNNYESSLKQLASIRSDIQRKIQQNNTYIQSVKNNESDQSRHDLLAQENQELKKKIDDMTREYFGETQ